jgi:hypothetical protein
MYPDEDLTRLAGHKAALRRNIVRSRAQCAQAAAGVLQPLERLDRVLAFWRRISPIARFAAVPLGFVLKRVLFRRSKMMGSLVSWAPLVAGVIRGIKGAITAGK